jgi:hypothetical protein
MKAVAVAGLLGITQSAVTKAAGRGETFAAANSVSISCRFFPSTKDITSYVPLLFPLALDSTYCYH